VVVAYGHVAVDLRSAARSRAIDTGVDPAVFASPSLNPLLELGRDAWRSVRAAVAEALGAGRRLPEDVLVERDRLTMLRPVDVGDYVDGYGGIHHAANAGRILRPGAEPLAENWWRMPVAYHGRAGTVVVSGEPVRRPRGQVPGSNGVPTLAPSARLDFELEVGLVVGTGSALGCPIPIDAAAEHMFGIVLLNDWSARDIQAYESRPLGPFLSKSFATSMSAWVVTIDALRPYLVPGLPARQDPEPAQYLRGADPSVPDLRLEVLLRTPAMAAAGVEPAVISRVSFPEAMYWSMAQQLAHATANGASTRAGDLFGSGTASGPDRRTGGGSLLELTWDGTEPLELPGGERRTFLEDGDTVVLRGRCPPGAGEGASGGLSLGEVVGTVEPASPAPG
jgi:fumarylacetoacetase